MNNDHTETLSERLRFHRRSLRWSQDQLAHEAGCQRSQISGIELQRANPTLATVANIAAAMGMTLRDLLTPLTNAQRKTL